MKQAPRHFAPRDDACMKVIAKPAGLKQSRRRCAPRDDDGFGLLELMLAAMIAAGITLGYLYNQSRQSAISQAQSQAGYYQMVSDAVAKYMANNYDQLKAITKPQTCSEPRLFTEATDATDATAPTGCGIQALFLSGSASSPVANGLQPTLTDLKTTGYLDANFSNSFLWPTQLTMYAASGVSTGSSYAAPEYRVQIQAWCNGAAPSTDTVCDKPVLHSLVYNAQPFAANTTNSFINFSRLDKLLQARTTLGANAFISYDWALQKDKLIYSEGNKNQLPNLLKFTSGSDLGIGLEGVLALQATYMPSQVSISPAPTPPEPKVMGAAPFSKCDPQTDKLAFAAYTVARVVPSNFYTNGVCEIKGIYRPYDIYSGFRYPAYAGAALTCQPNTRATSHVAECPPPEDWPMCTTRAVDALVRAPKKDGDDADKPWCWQPVTEDFVVSQPRYQNHKFVADVSAYLSQTHVQTAAWQPGPPDSGTALNYLPENSITAYSFPMHVHYLQYGRRSYSSILNRCSIHLNTGCWFSNIREWPP